ncbi:hypothetical protein E8E14_001050 [Neopestalotiopsis sp. 37M]|nr:hypothetical protein E8E14_001050 [Neopestalotiopsis sp. 37M]
MSKVTPSLPTLRRKVTAACDACRKRRSVSPVGAITNDSETTIVVDEVEEDSESDDYQSEQDERFVSAACLSNMTSNVFPDKVILSSYFMPAQAWITTLFQAHDVNAHLSYRIEPLKTVFSTFSARFLDHVDMSFISLGPSTPPPHCPQEHERHLTASVTPKPAFSESGAVPDADWVAVYTRELNGDTGDVPGPRLEQDQSLASTQTTQPLEVAPTAGAAIPRSVAGAQDSAIQNLGAGIITGSESQGQGMSDPQATVDFISEGLLSNPGQLLPVDLTGEAYPMMPVPALAGEPNWEDAFLDQFLREYTFDEGFWSGTTNAASDNTLI